MTTQPSAQPAAFAGKFRLLRQLGKGAMGEVWLAEEEGPRNFRRRVAVKKLLQTTDTSGFATESFVAEAQVIARLDHPNIVRLIELGSADGALYLVLDYVDGAALDRMIKKGGALSPKAVAYIGREIARALEAVHTMSDEAGRNYGVVHRDVTPSNILIGRDGRVRLSDFGVARISGLGGEKTETGVFKGKLPYMPPEQARGEAFDGRADIFSLGITLFEGLLGRRLRRAETQSQLIMMIATEPVAKVRTLAPDVQEILAFAIDGATSVEAAKRTADSGELAQQLDAALRSFGPRADKEAREELRQRVELVAGPSASITSTLVGDGNSPSTGEHAAAAPQPPAEWSVLLRNSGSSPQAVDPGSNPTGPSFQSITGTQPTASAKSGAVPLDPARIEEDEQPTVARAPHAMVRSSPPGSSDTNVASITEASGQEPSRTRPIVFVAAAVVGVGAAVLVFTQLSRRTQAHDTPPDARSSAPPAASTAPTATAVQTVAPSATAQAPDVSAAPTARVPGPGPRIGPRPTASAEENVGSTDPGTLQVVVLPWADVSVDGRSVGTTPIAPVQLSPGAHSVTLRNSELGATRTMGVTIKPGKPFLLRVDLRRESGAP